VGNIYLSVNAEDVVGARGRGRGIGVAVDTPPFVFSCKTSPSLIDAINSEVSSSISGTLGASAGAGAGMSSSQQHATLIDTSTCAVTCLRCGVYVGDGQVVDRDDEEGDEGGETASVVPEKGNFVLREMSNIRFIRNRVHWIEEKQEDDGEVSEQRSVTGGASSLLYQRVTTEQLLAQLLTAASSLFGSSTFELYVPNIQR
jgi:hypothetical protein